MNTPHNFSIEALEPRLAPAGIYVVDDSNHLIKFDSATPGVVTSVDITGLLNVGGTEVIKGIDFRPANGKLYGLGITNTAGTDAARIYIIDPTTGVATVVNATPFATNLVDNDDFGFDINPATDRIRVVTDRDENLRVNPNDGTLVATDTTLNPGNPALVGVAYNHNYHGATTTTLYGIDNATDSLVIINPPNNGTLNVVGALGVAFTNFKVGFDIEARTDNAFAVLRPTGGETGLYSINLATGAATLLGAVGGNPSLNGMTVALPDDLTIVNATTATYIDVDGDKVTVQITGAAPGAALSKADFGFAVGQFGSQLRLLDFSDDGQEWAKANITINAVPVGAKGDSFATVGFINAAGVDLGKVSINGDLGRIDAGLTGNAIPGLASLTVQSFGVFSDSQVTGSSNVSHIVGALGGLTVKSDFANALLTVTDTDGAIASITIGGNLDGRGATTATGITATKSMGAVTVNGSIFGGSIGQTGKIFTPGSMGNVIVGGSIFGGTENETGYIASNNLMGTVLVKGSIFGGTQYDTGYIAGYGGMGATTVKGSIVSGVVVDPATDAYSGCLYTNGNMGALVIGGNLIGGGSNFSGNVYVGGTLKSVTVAGSLKGGGGAASGGISVQTGIGNATVTGDLLGGAGNFSGSIATYSNGSIGNVTVGGSVIGSGNAYTGIISDLQLGVVKITGEVANSRISADGGTGSPAALLAIKSLSIGLGVQNAQILAGYGYNDVAASNANATLGPVTIGGSFVTSNMKAGGMGAITIKGSLDGRGAAAPNGIFSLGVIGNLNLGGSLYGGTVVKAGIVESAGAMGTVTIGGSIYGGTASYAGNIEAGATMGNVLVNGNVFGGTDDHTGNIHSYDSMGNVTVKGSIIGGTVMNAATDLDSGLIYALGSGAQNMGAVVIGGNLVGSNGDFSGSLYAGGTIKSVAVGGYIKGSSGAGSGNIEAQGGVGKVTIAGDMIGGSGVMSGSIYSFGTTASIGDVTVGGSLIGGQTFTGIVSTNQIGAVKINGGMTGGRISAEGALDAATAALAGGIKSISIGGTVQNALILAGYNVNGTASNADASIGAVTVGGNWIASNLIAGVDDGADNFFGTNDDVKITEAVADSIFASIASVTIKGYATGTVGSADNFGICAEQIGAIKIGAQSLMLAPGTDTTGFFLGSTNDFRVREV